MQTFRSQSSSSNNASNDDAVDASGIKKAKYVPYIPGETNLSPDRETKALDGTTESTSSSPSRPTPPTPDSMQVMSSQTDKQTPEQIFAQTPSSQPLATSQVHTIPPVHETPKYVQPQYVQYVPNENTFTTTHAGMDRETFRKMIIGVFGVLFILFIILIIAFSGKNIEHKLPPDLLVFQPQAQQKIVPPVTITGQARGYWYFNNEFPVALYDSTNTAIAFGTAKATATSANMNDFLPFTAVINEYAYLPAKSRGYILFQRSTGDIQQGRDNTARVPIRFGEGTGIMPVGQTGTDTGDTPVVQDPDNPSTPITSVKQCGDGIDNDNDNAIDMQDPECHTDGNASNSVTYDKTRREDNITITLPNVQVDVNVDGFSGNHNGFVTLYFPNTAENPIQPSCSKVFPVRRELSSGALGTTVEKTLRALFLGPTVEEGYSGFATGMKRGMTLDHIQLVGDVLAIYVTNNSIVGDPSWCTLADIKKQIYQTMVQFAGVNNIRIYANGQIL